MSDRELSKDEKVDIVIAKVIGVVRSVVELVKMFKDWRRERKSKR